MKYFITFIDHYTRKDHIYLLKDKLGVLEVFMDYKSRVENQLERKIKVIRSDSGKEYCNKEMENFLSRHRIEH